MFKNLLAKWASWRLDSHIRAGRLSRGRSCPLDAEKLTWKYKIRTWWKEVGLSFRIGKAASRDIGKALRGQQGSCTAVGRLYATHIKGDGTKENKGLIGTKVVTTAFVNFMVDQLQAESTEWGDFKYHDSGIGTTAENAIDTDIETTDAESRVTGSQTEGASANIYKSVGTISYTTTKAITEHGLFSQVTGGTLMDRTVFSAINVVNLDSIQFTYELTVPAGS